jgi:hypothetical protein
MADHIYVYSTLSSDQLYTSYTHGPNGLAIPNGEIFISGKANVMDKHFITRLGVATKITAEQLVELKKNDLFNLHVKNGFIKYDKAEADAEVVAADMQGRDQSAPLVEQDFAPEEVPAVNKRGRKAKR